MVKKSLLVILIISVITNAKSENLFTTMSKPTISEKSTSPEVHYAIIHRKEFKGMKEQIERLNSRIDNLIDRMELLNFSVVFKEDLQYALQEISKNIFTDIKQNIQQVQQELIDIIFESNKQNINHFNEELKNELLNLSLPTKQDMKIQYQEIKKNILEDIKENNQRANTLLEELKDSMSDSMKNYTCGEDLKPKLPRPTSCANALRSTDRSGVYKLYEFDNSPNTFAAYCLQDPQGNGSAWTLIQRRQDGSVPFDRNWQAYKEGFGNIDGEYWLGLDKIHAITRSQPHELWIQLEKFGDEKGYAKYDDFVIGSEASQYALGVLGNFQGDVDDRFQYYHNTMQFSTMDNDNDMRSMENCAENFNGGWWYNGCYKSNLNGKYHSKGQAPIYGKGIHWADFVDGLQSLKYVHMAIRPVHKFERKNIL